MSHLFVLPNQKLERDAYLQLARIYLKKVNEFKKVSIDSFKTKIFFDDI